MVSGKVLSSMHTKRFDFGGVTATYLTDHLDLFLPLPSRRLCSIVTIDAYYWTTPSPGYASGGLSTRGFAGISVSVCFASGIKPQQ